MCARGRYALLFASAAAKTSKHVGCLDGVRRSGVWKGMRRSA